MIYDGPSAMHFNVSGHSKVSGTDLCALGWDWCEPPA